MLLLLDHNDRSNFSRTKFLFLCLSLDDQSRLSTSENQNSITCHFTIWTDVGKQTRNGEIAKKKEKDQ